MNINLIKLKESDWQPFTKWWRDSELINLTSGNHSPMSDEEIQKQVNDMANDENSEHWLIDADSKIIGHININKIDEDSGELQIIVGEKEYWGKGIGGQAIDHVLNLAKNKYSKFIIEVRPSNSRALNLYKKAGFIKTGIKKYPDNSNLSETVVMEKINE